MKRNDINSIINEALIKEARTKILEEQTNENMETEKDFLECLHGAKNENQSNFIHGGKQYSVEECFKQLEEKESMDNEQDWVQENDTECSECGNNMNESKKNKMKKPIAITKGKINNIIKKIVAESESVKQPIAVNGLSVTNRVRKDSKKEEDEYMSELDKKLKKYLSFDGNDNPEFPNQIGSGEKEAYRNTSEEDEYTEENRGGGLQDLKFENEPSKSFVERIKKALEGHPTMGNAQDGANAIKSKTGEKLSKLAAKKIKNKETDPMYVKDPQPVVNKKSTVNENTILMEEIRKMKDIYSYNKKTQ